MRPPSLSKSLAPTLARSPLGAASKLSKETSLAPLHVPIAQAAQVQGQGAQLKGARRVHVQAQPLAASAFLKQRGGLGLQVVLVLLQGEGAAPYVGGSGRIDGAQLRQHAGAQAVSGIAQVLVGGILPIGQTVSRRIFRQLRPIQAQQRPQHAPRPGAHATKPGKAAAPRQVQQHRLGLIVPIGGP